MLTVVMDSNMEQMVSAVTSSISYRYCIAFENSTNGEARADGGYFQAPRVCTVF